MKNTAVLASGQGSNLEAILRAVEKGEINGQVRLVISDRADAYALKRAERFGVENEFLDPAAFSSREVFDRQLTDRLLAAKIDLVVLAGFMRLLSPLVVNTFPLRIINIHPSLLPAFPGLDGAAQALGYGVKVTGATVHFVDEGLDSGPVILQEAVPVMQNDNEETLQQRIHGAEHRIYPTAIDLFCRDKLAVEGRRCLIID